MKLYCGMDLHANNTVVVVINEEDQVLLDKRLPQTSRLYQSDCITRQYLTWIILVGFTFRD